MKIRQRYVGPEGADQDRYWMRRALAQARLAEGATSPNPPVGAMLVKDSKLLAQINVVRTVRHLDRDDAVVIFGSYRRNCHASPRAQWQHTACAPAVQGPIAKHEA